MRERPERAEGAGAPDGSGREGRGELFFKKVAEIEPGGRIEPGAVAQLVER